VHCLVYAAEEKLHRLEKAVVRFYFQYNKVCVKIKCCLEESLGKATRHQGVQYLTPAADNATIHLLIILVYVVIYFSI